MAVVYTSTASRHVFHAWISLPVIGVVSAFVIAYGLHFAVLFDYKWGCRNVYLPSVSRILNLPFERILWNLLNVASLPLHFLVLFCQYARTFPAKRDSSNSSVLRVFLVGSSLSQALFLSLLATVGERESGALHVVFFCGYTSSTLVNFVVFAILMAKAESEVNTKLHTRRRIILLACLFTSLPTIFITFILHNLFCITAAYELFACFEYLTILEIYAFHLYHRHLFLDSHAIQFAAYSDDAFIRL